jgi:hypothetical protein
MGTLIRRLLAVLLLSAGPAAPWGAGDFADRAARRSERESAPLSARCRGPLAMTTRSVET